MADRPRWLVAALRLLAALSVMAGLSVASATADAVAKANQGTYESLRDFSALPVPSNIHFLSHDEAQEQMSDTLADDGEVASPQEFGRSLHGIQDYYRHRGFGFVGAPGYPGLVKYAADCIKDGEEFHVWEAIRAFNNWGHAIPSARTRYVLRPLGLEGKAPWVFPDPDSAYGTWDAVDSRVLIESAIYIGMWLDQYLAHLMGQDSEGASPGTGQQFGGAQ